MVGSDCSRFSFFFFCGGVGGDENVNLDCGVLDYEHTKPFKLVSFMVCELHLDEDILKTKKKIP